MLVYAIAKLSDKYTLEELGCFPTTESNPVNVIGNFSLILDSPKNSWKPSSKILIWSVCSFIFWSFLYHAVN